MTLLSLLSLLSLLLSSLLRLFSQLFSCLLSSNRFIVPFVILKHPFFPPFIPSLPSLLSLPSFPSLPSLPLPLFSFLLNGSSKRRQYCLSAFSPAPFLSPFLSLPPPSSLLLSLLPYLSPFPSLNPSSLLP